MGVRVIVRHRQRCPMQRIPPNSSHAHTEGQEQLHSPQKQKPAAQWSVGQQKCCSPWWHLPPQARAALPPLSRVSPPSEHGEQRAGRCRALMDGLCLCRCQWQHRQQRLQRRWVCPGKVGWQGAAGERPSLSSLCAPQWQRPGQSPASPAAWPWRSSGPSPATSPTSRRSSASASSVSPSPSTQGTQPAHACPTLNPLPSPPSASSWQNKAPAAGH